MPSLTQEQITQARETDLLDYLLSHESGVLKREGANYRHREHDSLVYVASKNYWYWNTLLPESIRCKPGKLPIRR